MAGSIYQTVFGGSLVAPANPTYLALSISVNTVLGWPLESNITSPATAEIIDVTATVGGLTLQLSDARQVGTGYCALFNNVGANTFSVLDAQGNTLMAVASGQAWQIYISDNSTLQGTWRVFQYGAGVSNANAGALAGNGLKAISTTLNERIVINPQAANYAIQNTDRAACVEWTGGSGGTFTAPAPATVGSDWFCYIKNSGTGVLTLSPAGGTIDGSASKSFNPNDSCILASDGINLFTMGFGQSVASSFNFVTISLAGASGTVVLTGAQLNRISYKFTGALAGNTTVQVPASIQQYWIDNETTGAFTLTISAGGAGSTFVVPQSTRVILYCDGLNIISAVSGGAGGTTLVADGSAASPGLAWASDTQMGLYKAGVDSLGFSTTGLQRGVISSTGSWSINAPTSGNALLVTSATNNNAIVVNTSNTASQSFGVSIRGGTNTGDYGLLVQDTTAAHNYFQVRGDGAVLAGFAGGGFTVANAGNVTVGAPSSGTALTVNATANGVVVNGAASSFALSAQTTALAAGTSFGLNIVAGTNSGDNAVLVRSQAGAQIFQINGAGNVTISAPASGIAETVNAAAASAAIKAIGSGSGVEVVQLDNSAGDTRLGLFSAGTEYGTIQAVTNSFNLSAVGASTTLKVSVNTGVSTQISATGNVTINAPTSGITLGVTAVAGGVAGQFVGAGVGDEFFKFNNTAGDTRVTWSSAGTKYGLIQANTNFFNLAASGASTVLDFGVNNGTALQIQPAGNVAINAPSSGVALSATAAAGALALNLINGGVQVTNNGLPCVAINSAGADFGLISNTAANTWSLGYGTSSVLAGTSALSWNATGNITVAAPSSGHAVFINTVAGSEGLAVVAPNTASSSFGCIVEAGTNSSDYALVVLNAAASLTSFKIRGDGVVFGNDGTNLFELGYKGTPSNGQAGNYTLVNSDKGKVVGMSTGFTLTVPNGVFSDGDVVVVRTNAAAGNVTISQGVSFTLYWANGTGVTSGSRTMAAIGLCTIEFVGASAGYISGGTLS
jgi:hypothetical protein